MFKRVLCAAGLAGALFVAAPTAAFAHDGNWRHGSGCGRHGWHHHHHHQGWWGGGNWNRGNDQWNNGWNCDGGNWGGGNWGGWQG